MKFKVVIQNVDGSEKWEIPYKSFSFSDELNKDRQAQIAFDNKALEAVADTYSITPEYIISAEYREVYIYDEDENVIYSGFIDEPTVSGDKEGGSQTTITSRGFFSLFAKRYTNEQHTAEDMSDIAWNIIDTSQGETEGDFGITRGADPSPTTDRDRNYYYKNIKEAIEKLSNNNIDDGIDFDVNHSKQFNVYYPTKGATRANLKLEWGHNINTYSVRKTGILGMANQVAVFGETQGDEIPVEVRTAAAGYLEAYFLLQETLSEKDVSEAETLQEKGDAYLENYKTPRKEIGLTVDFDTPNFNEYDVGDTLPVKISDGAVNINDNYRLRKRTVNDDGTVYLTLFPL